MNSGVTSSLSPNQNASTSLRPMPASATSRILDSSRFWMALRMRRLSVEARHPAGVGHFGLRCRELPDHAEAITGAFDVELHARCAGAVHHADGERLLELVVRRAHRAGLAMQRDAGVFE